ncbi:MAG: DnaJ domain-containing protein [Acidobacteria bacterium]|nr:DnaJ domain-containing protein [Acidobacteriota bacterium]
MDFKDYYSTLGVAKTANQKEIKQAFRKLARKHHPDFNPGDKSGGAKFKEINEAYEVLGDPEKREKYDELGSNWRMYEQAGGPAAGQAGGAWNVPFGGGAGGGFRSMTEDEMHEMFGDANPFSDFFQTFFGGSAAPGAGDEGPRRGRAGRGSRGPRAGRDVEQEIVLGLEDAYHGAMRRLSIKLDGHARTVDVRIPVGVGDGSRVRVSGEGEQGSGGAHAGDLYLRIRLAPHAKFERRGRDLYTHVPVPLTTAVLGGEAEVMTLAGKPLRLKIPPSTQPAQVFRLKGHGMPATGKPGDRGDLYATVDVELPHALTTEQRTLFEALRKLETKNTKHSAA